MNILLPLIFQCFSQSPTTHEYLGSCRYQSQESGQPGIVSVYQNLNTKGDDRLMSFEFFNESCEHVTEQSESQIDFVRSYIWPWSDEGIQWLKYRNGKAGMGMMKWHRESGEGYLRRFKKNYNPQTDKYDEKYFYLDVTDCNIDLTNVDFAGGF
ncbi:hypothetical protein CIK05_09500 [Bdellovibrio sp. qaytius]|nr:hypothetical protein CIK05_09500 [Bdellovibrio sp. qaytius]